MLIWSGCLHNADKWTSSCIYSNHLCLEEGMHLPESIWGGKNNLSSLWFQNLQLLLDQKAWFPWTLNSKTQSGGLQPCLPPSASLANLIFQTSLAVLRTRPLPAMTIGFSICRGMDGTLSISIRVSQPVFGKLWALTIKSALGIYKTCPTKGMYGKMAVRFGFGSLKQNWWNN